MRNEFKYPVTENCYPRALKKLEETLAWPFKGFRRPERFSIF